MRTPLLLVASLLVSGSAFAQVDLQLHVRQMPGWDARAREGRCEFHVWIDNRAEIRMRGDTIFVRTLEGAKGRDEGSVCSQPLPYNSVRDFQIRQTSGRNRVVLNQEPNRMNNFTAVMTVDDPQGGGDSYTFEATWRGDDNVNSAPAPFFDDVRACQEIVRQRFISQNGRGSYVDFENFAERQGQVNGRGPGRGRGQETIEGHGVGRRQYESRNISYSCVVDTRQNQVLSGEYRYSGESLRPNERRNDNRPLR